MKIKPFLGFLGIIILVMLLILPAAHAQTITWEKYLSDGRSQARGYGVATYSDYVIVVGRYQNGTGFYKAFVANLSKSDGSLNWIMGLKIIDTDKAHDVAVDEYGNIYIVGWSSDYDPNQGKTVGYYEYVAKLSPSGNLEWSKVWSLDNISYGGYASDTKALGVAVGADGYVYVAGTIPEPGGTYVDCLIMKLDPSSGSIVWSKKIGASGANELPYDIDAYGGYIYVTGKNSSTSPGSAFLLKLDTNGGFIWGRTWTVTNHATYGGALTIDSNGNITVTGHFLAATHYDIFITKFNENGDLKWAKKWGADGSNEYACSIVAGLNRLGIVGRQYILSTEDIGALILTLDYEGSLDWHKIWNGSKWDVAYDLAAGSLYIVGGAVSPSLTLSDVSGTFEDATNRVYQIFGGTTTAAPTISEVGEPYTTVLPHEATTNDRNDIYSEIFIMRLDPFDPLPPPPPPSPPAAPVGGEIDLQQLPDDLALFSLTFSALMVILAALWITARASRKQQTAGASSRAPGARQPSKTAFSAPDPMRPTS